MANSGHLPDERIVQLVMKELGRTDEPAGGEGPAAGTERSHLLACGACAHRVRELRDLLWTLELAGAELDPDRVEQVWQEAKDTARARGLTQRLRDGLTGAVRDLVASIAPETLVPSPAVRGSGAAVPAVQVFVTDEYAVSLSVTVSSQADQVRLVGSITPRTSQDLPSGGRATIYGGTEVIGVDVNSLGEFEAERVPPGDLHIDIELGASRIQLSPIHAGRPASEARED